MSPVQVNSMSVGTIAPVVKVDGAELAATVLNSMIGLRISRGLRIPSRAVLEFLDEGFAVSAGGTFGVGKEIIVAVADGSALFTGQITGVELDVERGAPNISIVADDASCRMTVGNKVRTFTRVTYSDVVTQVAREYGVTARTTATDGVNEYLLQTDSDFGFLTELADRVGYDWWVDASGDLQFHPAGSQAGSPVALSWDEVDGNLHTFSVRASALHPGAVTALGWNAASKASVSGISDTPPHAPTATLVTPYRNATELNSYNRVTTAHRMFDNKADGDALATSVAARSLDGSVVATGVCTINPAIAVGGQVDVSGVGPASGTYWVTEVEHVYSQQGFDTRFTAGDREPTSLVDTLAPPPPSSFRQDSLVIGVVTNLGDNTSPKGYVKVKFPTLGEQIESAWARVVSTGAGDSRGMTFLPEINDEVIVGFEGGDVTRPLILGGLYSGASAALDYGTADGKVAKRQIVSRLGHVIELGDGTSPADEHIWLTLAGGQFFVKLGKDGLSASVPSGKPVSVSAGNSKIQIDDAGNIALAGQKISIKAEQDVEISGMNVKIKSNANVEASAGAQLKLSGSAQAEMSSGGQTAVKGSLVMIN